MTSNKNQTGLESIRLSDKKIEDLPIAERDMAISQLPKVIESDKSNKRMAILAKYPKPSKEYLESRIKEAKENIERISDGSANMLKQIREYEVLITECGIRDEKIDNLKDNEVKKDIVKKMYKELPPYSIPAMNKQISQWDEGMERCNTVVKQEYLSIAELTATLALCRLRDSELRVI